MNKKTGFLIFIIICLIAVGAFVVLRKFNPTVLHYSTIWGFEPTLQTIETAVITAIQGSPGAVFTALSAAIGGIALAIRQVVSMKNSTETLVTDLTNKGSALVDQARGETSKVLVEFDEAKKSWSAERLNLTGTIEKANDDIKVLQDDRYKLQQDLTALNAKMTQVQSERDEFYIQLTQYQKQTTH
jgi:chromosome segregation ATPase